MNLFLLFVTPMIQSYMEHKSLAYQTMEHRLLWYGEWKWVHKTVYKLERGKSG